jgi:hypothetical protein
MACLQPSLKAQERQGPNKKKKLPNLLGRFGNTATIGIKSTAYEKIALKLQIL